MFNLDDSFILVWYKIREVLYIPVYLTRTGKGKEKKETENLVYKDYHDDKCVIFRKHYQNIITERGQKEGRFNKTAFTTTRSLQAPCVER